MVAGCATARPQRPMSEPGRVFRISGGKRRQRLIGRARLLLYYRSLLRPAELAFAGGGRGIEPSTVVPGAFSRAVGRCLWSRRILWLAGVGRSVPERTAAQRLRALGLANEVRSGRARLKRELAAGRVELASVLVEPPACAATARVYELLLAVPKVGPARATRWLAHCRIALSKTVAGLSERQRRELLELLSG